MNRLARLVIVFAAGATLAQPASARLLLSDLPQRCWREIGMVCGGEPVSTELCLRSRGNRLSERCQREIISRIEAAVARAREEAAKPDAAAETRPAA